MCYPATPISSHPHPPSLSFSSSRSGRGFSAKILPQYGVFDISERPWQFFTEKSRFQCDFLISLKSTDFSCDFVIWFHLWYPYWFLGHKKPRNCFCNSFAPHENTLSVYSKVLKEASNYPMASVNKVMCFIRSFNTSTDSVFHLLNKTCFS